MQLVIPFFWFEGNAEEAMKYYAETFPDSKITHIERYTGDQGIPGEDQLKGKILTGIFEVNGLQMMCLDGGPQFKPGGNISIVVKFKDQAELDKVWDHLMDGGKPQQCGWIVDKFGTTWQIVPQIMDELMSSPDATPAQKQALATAMMPMVKLDGPKLKAAFDSAK